MNTTRRNILIFAEAMDAWRVIPRMMLLAYGYLVFSLYIWYKNIPTYVQEKCDANILTSLMKSGMTVDQAKSYACTVMDVVGGPTAAQSTFVTTIIGLSTGIFGLYTTTGRKWDHWEPRENHGRDRDDDYRDSDYRDNETDEEGPDVVNKTKARNSIQIFASAGEDSTGPKAPDVDMDEGDHPPRHDSPRP